MHRSPRVLLLCSILGSVCLLAGCAAEAPQAPLPTLSAQPAPSAPQSPPAHASTDVPQPGEVSPDYGILRIIAPGGLILAQAIPVLEEWGPIGERPFRVSSPRVSTTGRKVEITGRLVHNPDASVWVMGRCGHEELVPAGRVFYHVTRYSNFSQKLENGRASVPACGGAWVNVALPAKSRPPVVVQLP